MDDDRTDPNAWADELASKWEDAHRMLRENYPDHHGFTVLALCMRDCAAALRKRGKADEP